MSDSKIFLQPTSKEEIAIIIFSLDPKLMYKRLHTFLNNNNIIYNLQFGFRKHYYTSCVLINITEKKKINKRGKYWLWSFC